MDILDTAIGASNRQERKYRRFYLEFPVLIRFECDGSAVEVKTISKNVSMGGLLVRSVSMIPLHTAVNFIMSVQGKQAVRPIRLGGRGATVRVESNGSDATFYIAIQCQDPVAQLEDHLPA